ncbi:Asterix [Chlorella sorokiniana]|uniref:Asterix n=1 Tax=Chlorella sorokiniana TaxID=3076 RepID=A0A2P6U1J5_CHLSO|nr:Asterix [Chlorella sorokiniana]|eukprot:PRW60193.1 Asterix [Chlorella sorokiniana]
MDELPPDMFLICGLALGLVSLVFKAKVCAWGSLLLCLCGVASAKSGQSDLKQVVSSITFACFGLFSCYLQPLRERLPPAPQ